MTDSTDSPEPQSDPAQSEPKVSTRTPETPLGDVDDATAAPDPVGAGTDGTTDTETPEPKKKSALRELAVLAATAILLYYVMLTFVARPYLIPSESMEPTLHGCTGCVGDRIMVDKLTYRFGSVHPGDVVVFKGPPSWNVGYKSIRSSNTALRWVQNALSFIGFVPPDENDLVKRVIAVGGQTVQCRADTGLTVDGRPLREPYLNPATMMADPTVYPCLGSEFGPVTVPAGRLWVMGDNRTHSADSRAHCTSVPADALKGVLCTGDPMSGTVPVANVIGKARFIVWPPTRWGGVGSTNPQQGQ
ncbi:signal peptidase I [Mycobacterium sherrisii]|uniref:Signal peptidase I n=1 Tax=Mycobacterium sherrisii TaxID=243061 RepID=A0A1E3T7U7_9MYCO|nr:signal peptidase I [Mycobacterium sherrisii]MCV7028693.1 signal peptidase I [Mycobacterium sherrisii]MEC4761896.1 signal peptidase I [Mycobacterium sherrisii]ODR10474.1 signal peptidase I [Mycobacterium sherrisii]ORW82752.1 S26 family signal peptidase [Mycobacterium sherrisii]